MAEKIKRDRAFRRVGTCCDRGQSVAADFSAIDAGARRCVRAPAHRAARFTCERCNGRQASRGNHSRFCVHARTTMLHQRICFRNDARRRDKDRRTQACTRRQFSERDADRCARDVCAAAHIAVRFRAARTKMESANRGGAEPTGARAHSGTEAARFNSTSDRDRRRRLKARAPAIRRKPLSALGARGRTSRADADRSLSA